MQFIGLAVVVTVIAVLVLTLGLRILLRGNWFLAWLRGSFGIVIVLVAALSAAIAYDLSTYQQNLPSETLLHISISKSVDQRFELSVTGQELTENYVVEGDLWRLDVRELGWQGIAETIGLQPGYRLDRIKTIFSDKTKQPISRYAQARLEQSWLDIDLWLWAYQNRKTVALLVPKLVKSNYYPLLDGAKFQARLTENGVVITPANDIAERAVRTKKPDLN
ncbi:MAG: hypothetical protein M0Q29_07535 [Thiopseudomonas sp.]|nr:hypothetical protein [Thiopseudomonas sp.]MCK9465722.1 hypothetical protein [Thiopseudomonas sp.]